MRYSIFLTQEDRSNLKYEIVSQEFRVHTTRLLEHSDSFSAYDIINKNWLVNRSRTLVGKSIYVIEPDDYGVYDEYTIAWHNGEFELSLRRLDVLQFIEIICEIVQRGWLGCEQLNELLEEEEASFRIVKEPVQVNVFSIEKLKEETSPSSEHPNIRLLVDRMNSGLERADYSAVLHSSATIFETLAKDIIGVPSVQNQTLRSFFDRYRSDSLLPTELQDKIYAVCGDRNSEPLAGHGSTQVPTMTEKEAITLCELTKAFVRIEYKLQAVRVNENNVLAPS